MGATGRRGRKPDDFRAQPQISASTDTSLALAVSLTLLNLGTELDDGDMRTAAVDVLRRCDDRELASIARATEALYQAAEEGSTGLSP